MPKTLRKRLLDPALFLAFCCALAAGWLLVGLASVTTIDQVFAESGPIETASASFLILCAVVLSGDIIQGRLPRRWHLVVLTLAAGLRELDWDKAFTDSGIVSLRLYSGTAPLGQKIAGTAVLVLLVVAVVRLLCRDLGPWLSGLRAGRLWSWLLAASLAIYAVAKAMDGLDRKLLSWGVELSALTARTAVRLEEGLELFAAILVLQVAILSLRKSADIR